MNEKKLVSRLIEIACDDEETERKKFKAFKLLENYDKDLVRRKLEEVIEGQGSHEVTAIELMLKLMAEEKNKFNGIGMECD